MRPVNEMNAAFWTGVEDTRKMAAIKMRVTHPMRPSAVTRLAEITRLARVVTTAAMATLVLSAAGGVAQAQPEVQPPPVADTPNVPAQGAPVEPIRPPTITGQAPLAPMPAEPGPLTADTTYVTSAPEQAPPPKPFYRRYWFWGAVGVVAVTALVVVIAVSSSSGPDTPQTTLGNKSAF